MKEKRAISQKAKEKIQAAPKEFLRCGLLDGTEKLRSQLRDAAEGGQRQETEVERTQGKARTASRQAVWPLGKLPRKKEKTWSGTIEVGPDIHESPSATAPNGQPAAKVSQRGKKTMRVKTRRAVCGSSEAESGSSHTVQHDASRPKIKERTQASSPRSRSKGVSGRLPVGYDSPDAVIPDVPQIKAKDAYIQRQGVSAGRKKREPAATGTAGPEGQLAQPVEQERAKLLRARWERNTVRRTETRQEMTEAVTARRQESGAPASYHHAASGSPAQKDERPAGGPVREIFPGKRKVKEVYPNKRTLGRSIHNVVKGAGAPKQAAQTGARSVRAAQRTERTAALAKQRAVQAAGATRWTAVAVGKPVAKAAVSALRGAVSAIRGLMTPLAAGGGAVIAVVLVLCLVGVLLLSPMGIFFSGEAGEGGLTIPAVVREINQEYNDRVEAPKTGVTYDEVELSGTRAAWPEILAVYAVKTVTDPTNGQDVITMDDEKKELLKQVFWDMNEVSSFTSTVHGEEDEEDTTTLHIVTFHKTTDEMADLYGFNTEQRQQLAELLSDEYRDLWNAVLYGIGMGSGEIVSVALSQVGNVGGQPYWSWYGFSYRVDWCAIFVSWCANECGYIDAGVIPKFAGCITGSRWFKDRGLWQDKNYTPNPGDVIFFDWDDPRGFSWPKDGLCDHVGIVERVENGRIYTVEGNSGDKCCQRSYPIGYYEIYGYGLLCL